MLFTAGLLVGCATTLTLVCIALAVLCRPRRWPGARGPADDVKAEADRRDEILRKHRTLWDQS